MVSLGCCSNRRVSSFYEQQNIDHIIPIMTQPFDFKKNKSVLPEWQEQIIFNERFGYFVEQSEESPRVLLFFEVRNCSFVRARPPLSRAVRKPSLCSQKKILDFMTMEEARAKNDSDKHERGFRTIAWAFLKVCVCTLCLISSKQCFLFNADRLFWVLSARQHERHAEYRQQTSPAALLSSTSCEAAAKSDRSGGVVEEVPPHQIRLHTLCHGERHQTAWACEWAGVLFVILNPPKKMKW